MNHKKGDRVIAISHSEDDKLFIFGAGVYVGDEIPPELGIPNPKIELDNGQVVFGYECWWGSEKEIKKKYADFEFVEIKKGES